MLLFDTQALTDLLSPAELLVTATACMTAVLTTVLHLLKLVVDKPQQRPLTHPHVTHVDRPSTDGEATTSVHPSAQFGLLRISPSREELRGVGMRRVSSSSNALTKTALALLHRSPSREGLHQRTARGQSRRRGQHASRRSVVSKAQHDVPEEVTDKVRGRLRVLDTPCDFSGTWVVDKARSGTLDLHLEALGLPWIARRVACQATYKAEIEHRGLHWKETALTALFRNNSELRLDGKKQAQQHPVDFSAAESTTVLKGNHVVTQMTYAKHPLVQMIDRWLEDDGQTYVVRNVITLTETGVELDAVLYFTRT